MNSQPSLFPVINQIEDRPTVGRRYHSRRVEQTLTQVRQLHEELNNLLYAHPAQRPAIQSPKDVYDILRSFLEHLDHEELWVAVLDTRNRVLALVALYKGSVNASQVRVAEVFRQAIVENAPAIVVAHNHPSGDPTPSPDDVSGTDPHG